MRAALEARPPYARPVSQYLKLIRRFQEVYRIDPSYRGSPAALADAAKLYQQVGRQFSDQRYFEASIKTYQLVISAYPGSAFSRDALFTIGEIYRSDLNRPDDARRVFKQYVKQYPNSTKARVAREKIEPMSPLALRSAGADSTTHAGVAVPETASEPELSSESQFSEGESSGRRLTEVTGVRFWVGSNYSRVVIALGSEVKFNTSRLSNPDRLVFDLSNTRLGSTLAGKTFPVEDGFLRQLRIAQYRPTVTRAVLDVSKIRDYSVFSLPNPFRLVIDIRGVPTERIEKLKIAGRRVEDAAPAASTLHRAREGSGLPRAARESVSDVNEMKPGGENASRVAGGGSPARANEGSALSAGQTRPGTADGLGTAADLGTTEGTLGQRTSLPGASAPTDVPGLNASIARGGQGRPASHDEEVASAGLRPPQPPASRPASTEFGPPADGAREPASPTTAPLADHSVSAEGKSRTLTRVLGLKIDKIVVDAGHGGHDTGTVGPRGLREKDLVLDVALRLKALIERKANAEVILTRSDDTFIPLEERTAIANQSGADLFVSIHANASRDSSARGIETYYLNFTSDPHALEVAARENSSSAESVHQLQTLVKKIVLTEKISESHEFAAEVQRELYASVAKTGGQEDRGVKRAPFVVLIGANMPSILAEISFLTNPRDERLLKKPEYRQRIAEALYRGIAQYTRNLGGLRMAEKIRPPREVEARHARRKSEPAAETNAGSISGGEK